jgi:hypothetical protein
MRDFVNEYYYLEGKIDEVLVKSEAKSLENYPDDKGLSVWVATQEPKPVVYSSSGEWISWSSKLFDADEWNMATDGVKLYEMYLEMREYIEKTQGIRVKYVKLKHVTLSRQTQEVQVIL